MIYQGNAVSVQLLDDGIAELKFDLQGESVNKFNKETVEDLGKAVDAIKGNNDIKGLVVTSGKSVFIVGADITEFTDMFKLPEDEIAGWCLKSNQVFNAFEDLDIPKVVAVNGIALGGGLEMCLAADFRVLSEKAQVGLPEVKLGLFPGFGGTVRLPRVIGVDNAVEWIAAGGQHRAERGVDRRSGITVCHGQKGYPVQCTLSRGGTELRPRAGGQFSVTNGLCATSEPSGSAEISKSPKMSGAIEASCLRHSTARRLISTSACSEARIDTKCRQAR